MQKKYYEESSGKEKFRRSINTLFSIVNRNVRNQYRNSVLGIVWTVLNPLLNMVVIALVGAAIALYRAGRKKDSRRLIGAVIFEDARQ
ncbi:MAG: hypothetical protein J5765_02375, partial [Clostridia bacterium]|nr:hypothetical protein [Clostridia bacterium]